MMFSDGNTSTRPISAVELQERIAQAVAQKFTGVASISFLTGETMLLFFRQGDMRQVYFDNGDDRIRRITEPWGDLVMAGRLARLSLLSMSARRLVFEKAVLETVEGGKEKRKFCTTTELDGLCKSYEKRESATLCHIRWQSAEAFVLVPGSKVALKLASFSGGGSDDEDGPALDRLSCWSEEKCEVVQYHGSLASDAWIELHLCIFFEWFCNYLLSQYGLLTGRMMVTSAVQNLIIYALQSGWDIVRSGNTLVDQTVFGSPAEAARAYQELLAIVDEHIQVMVGPALLHSLKRQGLNLLNPFYQALGRSYDLISSQDTI